MQSFTVSLCRLDKGYIRGPGGNCICSPNTALNEKNECVYCSIEKGLKVERGHCVCALERGMIVDDRGNCVCPKEYGYRLDASGNCTAPTGPKCATNNDCPDHKFCNVGIRTCTDPCAVKKCGINAFCNATSHRAVCSCISGYSGDAETMCSKF